MKTTSRSALGIALLAAAGLLAGCGDRPQGADQSHPAKKADTKAWDGGGNPAYTAGGWKAGDRASWEAELKARNQAQNEYTRVR